MSNNLIPVLLLLLIPADGVAETEKPAEKGEITLRARGVPTSSSGAENLATQRMLEEFRRRNPLVDPVSSTGITIPRGFRTQDMVPSMQIAGDIAGRPFHYLSPKRIIAWCSLLDRAPAHLYPVLVAT
jgi:hypothetical protein